jgi:dipeptidyl aminopeptidase/acylaminoacyl peptidase
VFDSPVSDLVFDYGAFAYDSWMPRYGSWEYSQGRIGASLWSRPDLYLTNSPIMVADRITVPTLIMANDGDGTVPWTEGLELYVALRRLGREVYLLNYYGDQHQPGALANRVDIAKRTFEFFDVHLRGAPAPRWMSAKP